jgi:hypothetical protein
MKPERKLNFRPEHQDQVSVSEQTSQHREEAEAAEELIRRDAGRTTVPPGLAQRLSDSVREECAAAAAGQPQVPWWKRLLK